MEIPESIVKETRKTEEEIRKAEIREEIGNLKEGINRTGAVISGRILGTESSAAPAEEE
jgi:hypothetical protein